MRRKYLRMLEGMQADAAAGGPLDWSVYMLRCADGSLYTGIAKDVDARYRLHETGKGASYTRTHPPIALAFQEGPFTRSGALIREAQLKRLPKERKEEFLQTAVIKTSRTPSKRSNLRQAPSEPLRKIVVNNRQISIQ